jgi:hypothetical protein
MRLPALLLTLALLAGCGSTSEDTATDPAGPSSSAPPSPAPSGPVRTAHGLVTVIDEGEGPEVCLGAIAESYPPQCGGPAVSGWDWAAQMHDEQGAIRWGSYALTGTWDGTSLAVADAVPAALYDPAMPLETDPPTPSAAYDEEALTNIATQLQQQLPDAVMAANAVQGQVLADVYYDDGSLQEWADETYGAGVVLVSAAFVDAT